MFFGEYEYRVDPKGRLPLPPKFRPEFEEGLILTVGVEKCLILYPLKEWKELAEGLSLRTLNRSKQRRLNRVIFSNAYSLALDAQGRIAIPPALRRYAEISDSAVVVGVNTYIEIWDQKAWTREKALAQEQVWQIIESLENR